MMMTMPAIMTGDNKVLRARRVRRQMMESVASRWAANLFEQCNLFQYNAIQCNLFYTILYNAIQCNLFYTMQYNATFSIQYNTNLFEQCNYFPTLQYNTLQFNAIQQCNLFQYNTIQCLAPQWNAIHCNAILMSVLQCASKCAAAHCKAAQTVTSSPRSVWLLRDLLRGGAYLLRYL